MDFYIFRKIIKDKILLGRIRVISTQIRHPGGKKILLHIQLSCLDELKKKL